MNEDKKSEEMFLDESNFDGVFDNDLCKEDDLQTNFHANRRREKYMLSAFCSCLTWDYSYYLTFKITHSLSSH